MVAPALTKQFIRKRVTMMAVIPEIDDPEVGPTRFINSAIKMEEGGPEIRCPAPTLGQHNDEIYSTILGYSPEKIQELREKGII